MLYPIELIDFEDELQLYVPISTLVKTTYEQLLTRNSEIPFPFWAKIWPSARALAQFLKKEKKWITGKKVIEIGAGIGLPSFMNATTASEIIISDYNIEAVQLIEKNIEHLGLKHLKAQRIDWNFLPSEIDATTILLSDINYEPNQFDALLQVIHNFITQKKTIILATPQRITANSFVQQIQPYIKHSNKEMIHEFNEIHEISILVLFN